MASIKRNSSVGVFSHLLYCGVACRYEYCITGRCGERWKRTCRERSEVNTAPTWLLNPIEVGFQPLRKDG